MNVCKCVFLAVCKNNVGALKYINNNQSGNWVKSSSQNLLPISKTNFVQDVLLQRYVFPVLF